MTVWNTLEIEPTDDLRAIKRAYAAKLKVTRPDEDPEQFQILNTAYKNAQWLARQGGIAEVDEPTLPDQNPQVVQSDLIEVDTVSEQIMEPVESPKMKAEREAQEASYADYRQQMRVEFDQLFEKVDSLLCRFAALNWEANWSFIEQCPFMLDDEFNWQVSFTLFNAILQHNEKHKDSKERRLRSPGVFLYLDQYVDWMGKEEQLIREFGAQACRPYLDLLRLNRDHKDPLQAVRGGNKTKKVTKKRYEGLPHYVYAEKVGRIFAFLCDITLVILVVALIGIVFPNLTNGSTSILIPVSVGYMVMALLMESSPLQATPGKMLMGYRVMKYGSGIVPLWRNFFRVIFFSLMTGGLQITLWINIFLGNRLLHDRFTKTEVIDVRKSYQMYLNMRQVEL